VWPKPEHANPLDQITDIGKKKPLVSQQEN
jgi:hypothetical protein